MITRRVFLDRPWVLKERKPSLFSTAKGELAEGDVLQLPEVFFPKETGKDAEDKTKIKDKGAPVMVRGVRHVFEADLVELVREAASEAKARVQAMAIYRAHNREMPFPQVGWKEQYERFSHPDFIQRILQNDRKAWQQLKDHLTYRVLTSFEPDFAEVSYPNPEIPGKPSVHLRFGKNIKRGKILLEVIVPQRLRRG